MSNFNKKQKIILGILGTIVAGFICYYVYAKDEGSNTLEVEENLEIQEHEEKEESYSDDFILVHVSGAVNNEQIVELKVGSRVSDAIEKAGGLKEEAYTEEINLAYKLEDGMKIHIPTKQEKQQSTNTQVIITSSGVVEKEEQKEETKQKKVNINTATQSELETLSGIGSSTANKIITYRKEKGTFKKIEDIKNVSGIGEAKFNKIKDYITVK